jgi:ribosomal protein S27E
VSLSALELGPTKKEAPDGGLLRVEVPLCERATILFKHLALDRLKHLFAG